MVPSISQGSVVGVLAVGNVVLLGMVAWLLTTKKERTNNQPGSPTSPSRNSPAPQTDGAKLAGLLGQDYEPPLPEPVAQALDRACLCFLATSNAVSPHLSLMRFTYTSSLLAHGAEVLIMSTKRMTKKYELFCQNKNVALLVHDFTSDSRHDQTNYDVLEGKQRFSITLNGVVREESGDIAEAYRKIHLDRNREYAQFIVGEEIAILTVTLTSARVCDVNDSVRHWTKSESPDGAWGEETRS